MRGLCNFLLAEGLSASTRFPQNAAVVVGQSVIFHCRTESKWSIWWKFKSTSNAADEVFISKDGNFYEDRYAVNIKEAGQFDLHINYTRLTDAGTYICVEFLGNATVRHFSELVVFGRLLHITLCDVM